MKEHMQALSFQHCPDDMKVKPIVPQPHWAIPSVINVAYNGAFGPQNREI